MDDEQERERLLEHCLRLLEQPLRERDIFDETAQRRMAYAIAKEAVRANSPRHKDV
jgi:hypothetical protein